MEQSTNNVSGSSNKLGLSQIQLFVAGIVVGILVLCTVGFFILLGIMARGGQFSLAVNNNGVAVDARVGNTGGTNVAGTNQPTANNIVVAPITADDHVLGDKNAKVTIVEYSDFECPFCGTFYPTVKKLMDTYKGKVKLVYRHFPLSFHPEAQPAAEASECASEQGKFWEFHDNLFENQKSLGAEYYKTVAQKLGLNMSKFNDCVSTHKYRQKVQNQSAFGDAAGVQGTPHTILIGSNGAMVPVSGAQPYTSVEASLKQLL
jgi:protein-disulfide isomerase